MYQNTNKKRGFFDKVKAYQRFPDPNFKRVKRAKEYLLKIMDDFDNVHELIEYIENDSVFDDKIAIFNVLKSSNLFEYRGLHIAPTRKILEEWEERRVFHFFLRDDNFEEETGQFTINIDMSEQCQFYSYVDWTAHPLNVFS